MAKSRNKTELSHSEETGAAEELQTATTQTAEKQTENTEIVATPQTEKNETVNAPQAKRTEPDGVFVYLGPSIRGVIQNAAIFSGTLDNIIKSLSAAIQTDPNAERLIAGIRKLTVPSSQITAVKAKIKQGGNSYSHAYKELLK